MLIQVELFGGLKQSQTVWICPQEREKFRDWRLSLWLFLGSPAGSSQEPSLICWQGISPTGGALGLNVETWAFLCLDFGAPPGAYSGSAERDAADSTLRSENTACLFYCIEFNPWNCALALEFFLYPCLVICTSLVNFVFDLVYTYWRKSMWSSERRATAVSLGALVAAPCFLCSLFPPGWVLW